MSNNYEENSIADAESSDKLDKEDPSVLMEEENQRSVIEKIEANKFNWWGFLYVIDWVVAILLAVLTHFALDFWTNPIDIGYPREFYNSTLYQFESRKSIFPNWQDRQPFHFPLKILFKQIVPFFILMQIYSLLKRPKNVKSIVHDFHHAILGYIASVAVSDFCTNLGKIFGGSARPTYASTCGGAYSDCPDYDALKSFPSGHTSFSVVCTAYLSLYLMGKFKVLVQGSLCKLFIALLPMLLGTTVAFSRIWDHHHRYVDITAGFCVGIVSSLIYFLYYPGLNDENCNIPKDRYEKFKKARFSTSKLVQIVIEN